MKNKFKKIDYLKFISKILSYLPWALLILLIGLVFNIIIKSCSNLLSFINRSNSNIVSAIISAFAELIFVTGLTSIPKIRTYVINISCRIETIIYKLINKYFSDSWIKYQLINLYNSNHITPYKSQVKIIHDYIENLDKNENNLFYITGDDNSGKTTVIMLLFDQCINKITLYKQINKKAVYLCKSYSDKQIESFITKYLLGKYKNNYIFIDDIGDMPQISQIKLWDRIIYPIIESNICCAKVITIISNRNNPFFNNHILFNTDHKPYIVDGSSISNINKEFSLERKFFFKKHNIEDLYLKNIFNNIIMSCGEEVIDKLLSNDDSDIKSLFVCFIVASRYSKLVNIEIIKRIYKQLGFNLKAFITNIHILINSKIIYIFPFLNKHIYIDRQITNYFLNLYRKSDVYLKVISLYDNNVLNASEKWLNDCENTLLLHKEYSKQSFIEAFNLGNFNYLLNNLNDILLLDKQYHYDFSMELGYLNEKVGNRQQAANYLKTYIQKSTNVIDKQLSYLLLFEIQHHYDPDLSEIIKISNSKDAFVNLQGKYWIEHINIEKGEFNYDRLLGIVTKYSEIENKNSINYYHVLRRMFSDLARVYFLHGRINISMFNQFKKSMEASNLKEHHIEYDDFYNLLVKAHYLHYDLIFQLGFYRNLVHNCDDKYGENPNLNDVLNIAIAEYSKCEFNFRKYGDKAWITVSIRKNELLLCSNVQIIKILDDLYSLRKQFAENDNDLHLAFIECVICKAEFINYYLNYLEHSEKSIIKKCRESLNNGFNIYKNFGNHYGMYRIDFIRVFIDFFSDLQNIEKQTAISKFKSALQGLMDINYYREYEMINFILDMKNINSDLILRFFKYYPIISQ